jgi:hypothetical protein
MTDGNTHAISKYLDEREDYDALQEVTAELEQAEARIEKLEAKLARAVGALDEAVYLLGPDEEDMMMKAGVYRIVTTLAELKGQK